MEALNPSEPELSALEKISQNSSLKAEESCLEQRVKNSWEVFINTISTLPVEEPKIRQLWESKQARVVNRSYNGIKKRQGDGRGER